LTVNDLYASNKQRRNVDFVSFFGIQPFAVFAFGPYFYMTVKWRLE